MSQHEHAKGKQNRHQAKNCPHPLSLQHMLKPEDFSLSSDFCEINGAHGGAPADQSSSQLDTTTAA